MKNTYKILLLIILLTMMGKIYAQAPTRISEDFNTTLVPSGWTNSLNTGTLISRVTTVQSYGRTGTVAAVRANNYNVTGGSRAFLETPLFAVPTVLEDSLRFDLAHATYNTGEQDSLIVLAFDGVSYTRIAAWGSSPTIDLAGITTAVAQTAEFIPTSNQWTTKKLALPVGTTGVQFEFYSDFGNQLYIDKVIVDSFYVAPMVYNSSTTTQSVVSNVFNTAINQQIIGITVNVSGNTTPLDVTNFDFNTGATTNALGSIDSAKVFYTGSSNTFSATGRFGQMGTPNGPFSITGTQTLGDGNNYFWLVYDIKPGVTPGDTVDAECTSVTVAGVPQTPTITSPTGERIINVATAITVTSSAGVSLNTYNTLKAAIDNINIGYHQGDIDIRINESTTETATCLLDSSGNATGSSYTSILIRPADTATTVKTVSFTTTGLSALTFNGADNITIDGRPAGAGSLKLLRFNHTGTTAGSHNFNLTNGARFFAVRFCSFTHSNTALVVASNILLSTSVAPRSPNADIRIEDCRLQGGRAGVYFSATAANPMDSIWIVRNEFVDFAAVGILSTTGSFKKVVIDSNIMYQTANVPNAPSAIDIRHNAIGTNLEITRNRIFDMQTATSNFIRGIVVAPATTGTGTVILVANNFISLMQNGGSAATVRGFEFGGAGDVICRFIHNTVRIGGTHTGGTGGQVVSVGIIKTNTSALSTWVCRNNVSVNNRTGGTTGLFHSAAWVSGNGGSLIGTYDIDYNVYWATGGAGNGPFPAVWNGTLQPQAGQTAYRNAATPQEAHSIFANVNMVSNTDLSITGASVNDYLTLGAPLSAFVSADIFGTTRINPTYKGAHESTPFSNLKDAAVKEVYTLGKLPIPYAIPHEVRANIINQGIDTLFNQQVDLQISGANTFADVQFIDTILPGAAKIVNFAPYAYASLGACVLTVTVPADSTNSNNSKTTNQIITNDVYAYANPTLPAAGGVGFNGVGGDFIAKFPYSGSNNINQVGVNFNTAGQPYQIIIYDILNDTPGVLLWNSNTLTATLGVNTVPVFPPIGISGSFFVGVRQTGLVNVGFGYQAEDPIRNQVFYYKATTVTSWQDFATTNSAFRFMVEPRLQAANDLGASSVVLPCGNVVEGSAAFSPEVKVLNFGLNSQDSFLVGYQITGPVNSSGADTFGLVGLGSGSEINLSLSGLFNPNTAGEYTMKVWTNLLLTSDASPENDTLTYNFTVSNIDSFFNNSGNGIVLNGTTQSASVNGAGNTNIQGSMLSVEAWVNPTSFASERFIVSKNATLTTPQYSLSINTTGHIVFKLSTTNGVDSVVSANPINLLQYTHVAATYDANIGAQLYISGALEGTTAILGNIVGNTNPLYIGRSADGGNTHFAGSIDEVKIWDTTRTADQIRSNMHTRMANFAHANLIGYWRMDEIAGNVIADASGNCNSGALDNAPTFAASNIPMGSPLVYSQVVSSSGVVSFPNSLVSMNIFNQSGNNDYYIHHFLGAPVGTQPTGVTAVDDNNWIVYRYGAGTMDSAEVDFTTEGVNPMADPADFFLFSRGTGSSGTWLHVDTANMVNSGLGIVTFRILSSEFNKQFTVGANNNPLPVKLLYFTAKNSNADVNLRWATASETDNAGFQIERSVDGKNFKQINFTPGKGQSAQVVNYTLIDKDAFTLTASSKLYYRLVQTDFNGKKEISNTVLVTYGKVLQTTTAMYPNPFSSEVSISVDAITEGVAKIQVSDVAGKVVYEMTQSVSIGASTLKTHGLDRLPKGMYFVNLNVNGEVSTQKMVKQ